MSAALIGLDWGSSSLRAYLIGGDGAALATRSSEAGASRLAAQAAADRGKPTFEQALRELVGDWLQADPRLPLLASGMVGSAHGWVEAPYVATPVRLDALHEHLAQVQGADGLRVLIVPGVSHRPAGSAPDVMRGEETQVAGVLAQAGLDGLAADELCVVLPGTHSKWVQLRGGAIVALQTCMTGELFELLRTHSVLGRLMRPSAAFHDAAFEHGVRIGSEGQGADLASRLFSARTRGLFGEVAPEGLADYLSGLLIGHELGNALPRAEGRALVLAGEATLCSRYQRALSCLGHTPPAVVTDAAPRGLWRIAQQRWPGLNVPAR